MAPSVVIIITSKNFLQTTMHGYACYQACTNSTMVQVTNCKIAQSCKTNTPKEKSLCTCHRKLIKSGGNIETQFRNVTLLTGLSAVYY